MIRPVVVAYAALYHDNAEGILGSVMDEPEFEGGHGGQFEVAVNDDHQVMEIMGRRAFGFGPPERRA